MKHNFGAGPCILPQEVFKQAADAVLDFNGLSILEVSHRHKDFVAVMDEAMDLVKKALNVPAGYSIVYLQGGATLGFTIAALNMMRSTKKAGYINTGTWASGAIKEAKKVGVDVNVFASSEDKNFTYIPKNCAVPTDVDYIHFTSNNTIYGTQIKQFPNSPVPLVCDMSSDLFSRKVDGNKFALIYAGAQKNIGPAGSTMVMIHKDMVGKSDRKKLSMLDYGIHIKDGSMYNTPPVFPVYVTMLTLRWLKQNGGVEWIEKINNQKAELLYGEIDRNSMFYGTAATEDRSYMNVCFLLHKTELEAEFDKMAKEANLSGIRGHRSVGGYRASIYNAMPLESVQVLVDVMKEFEKKFA